MDIRMLLFVFQDVLYLTLQVDQIDTEGFLRAKYPTATNVIYLPISFSAVVKYLKPYNFGRYSFDFMIEDYVSETSGMLHHQETQKNYLIEVTAAKKQWLNRQKLQLEQQAYLGSHDFDTELKRSNGEFYNEIKKAP